MAQIKKSWQNKDWFVLIIKYGIWTKDCFSTQHLDKIKGLYKKKKTKKNNYGQGYLFLSSVNTEEVTWEIKGCW